MPRRSRVAPGEMVFHVLNRGVGRMRLLDDEDDYAAFERVAEGTLSAHLRVLPDAEHWHSGLWPKKDGDLSSFMQLLTVTHVARWQEHKHLVGTGHVHQGRYKSFPVETDESFYRAMRYVERNALRANLIRPKML